MNVPELITVCALMVLIAALVVKLVRVRGSRSPVRSSRPRAR
jgi:hypothetical protein